MKVCGDIEGDAFTEFCSECSNMRQRGRPHGFRRAPSSIDVTPQERVCEKCGRESIKTNCPYCLSGLPIPPPMPKMVGKERGSVDAPTLSKFDPVIADEDFFTRSCRCTVIVVEGNQLRQPVLNCPKHPLPSYDVSRDIAKIVEATEAPRAPGIVLVRTSCPTCGKVHVDDGDWRLRPHRTHLCVDDNKGRGCGAKWRVSGIDSPTAGVP